MKLFACAKYGRREIRLVYRVGEELRFKAKPVPFMHGDAARRFAEKAFGYFYTVLPSLIFLSFLITKVIAAKAAEITHA